MSDGDPERARHRVGKTYDDIASHFASTREYPWPEVEAFLADRDGMLGLDLGCANGRHAEAMTETVSRVVGVDLSRGLLREARSRASERGYTDRLETVRADAAALPLHTATIYLAVYVATLHHLPTLDARRESLDELARVLRPGAPALVSAWSTTHDRFDASDATTGFDTTVDWTLPNGETVPRFYHIYAPAEFRADLDASALVVDSTEVSSGNCYATVRGPE